MTPQISSLGTIPCTKKLTPIRTQGNHGALKTRRPRKLSRVSGFRRLHIYTNVLLRPVPRNGIDKMGAMRSRDVLAKTRSQEKFAGEWPDASSSRRE